MEKIMSKNYVGFLASVMKEAGCHCPIKDEEDVLKNLYYLSKEDGRGSRYLPLQYKRIVEKLILGFFSSLFEYEDKKDVYYEKIGDTCLCCANVYFVQYDQDGNRHVLGHGYHALSLDEVFPGTFMSDSERIAKWKSTVIGGAKSRALYDAGIGLEFYGDIFAPEENLDEEENKKAAEAPKKRAAKKKTETSSEALPKPEPKKAVETPPEKPKVPEIPMAKVATFEPEEAEEESEAEAEFSLEGAKKVIADIGDYKGHPLGTVYEANARAILFIARKSPDATVKAAAMAIIQSDENLMARFSA